MRLKVRAVPNSRRPSIEERDGILRVRVAAPAVGGKANRAVVEALSEYFGVKKNRVRIVNGETSRDKTVELL